jgi:hypothetical protein
MLLTTARPPASVTWNVIGYTPGKAFVIEVAVASSTPPADRVNPLGMPLAEFSDTDQAYGSDPPVAVRVEV